MVVFSITIVVLLKCLMTERQQHYLLAQLVPGVGNKTILSKLHEGQDIISVTHALLEAVSNSHELRDHVATYFELALTHGYDLVTWEDETYPSSLRDIPDPPVSFFIKGTLVQKKKNIAVVGSRMMTTYGESITRDLCEMLCTAGCTIVSGFMRGIDTVAHVTAVKQHTPTVAVLGSGFVHPVPPENMSLIDRIVGSGGAIISEFLPDQLAAKYTFPQRNRIVAGLCDAICVIEAGAKSGALITARLAAEQGKTVFAVPGSLYSTQSAGCHWLIQQGAEVVISIDNLAERLGVLSVPAAGPVPEFDSPLEEEIYTHVQKQQLHINEIILLVKKPTQEVLPVITTLELRGLLRNIGNDMYVVI